MFYLNMAPVDDDRLEFKIRYAFNEDMGRVLAFEGYTPANRQWLNEFFTEDELDKCRRDSVAVGMTQRGRDLLADAVQEITRRTEGE